MFKKIGPIALAAVMCSSLIGGAHAKYPEKPVQVTVPYSPGGPTDLAARLIATELSKRIDQSFIVENRGGAGGNVGAGHVARSAPDGYHLLVIGAAHAINKSLYEDLSYDIQKDFTPVAMLTTAPMVLLANPKFPPNSVEEMVAYADEHPGRINYASSGNGTAPHLAMELLKTKTGTDLVHIPYKGSAPALAATTSGQVDVGFDSLVVGKQFSTSGQLKALAVTGTKRSPVLPEIPTMVEAGYPDVDASVWYAIVAPASTPKEIVDFLNSHVNEILAQEDIRTKLMDLGADTAPMSPEDFGEFLQREVSKWAQVVKASGAQTN